MFRSTLNKIKKACARAVFTSTCREKSCDGLFSRCDNYKHIAPEFTKKAPNKATKYEEKKEKCLSIIDECFTPLEPYKHKNETDEGVLVDVTRRVHLAQIEKEKCENILYQCFGDPERGRSEETAEAHAIQTLHEIKHGDESTAGTVAREADSRTVRADDAVRSEETHVIRNQTQSPKGEDDDKSVFQDALDENEAHAIREVLKAVAAKEAGLHCRNGEAVRLIQVDNEIKFEKFVPIQKINEQSNCPTNVQQVEDDVQLDAANRNSGVKTEGSTGEYLKGAERKQFESDLKAIHKLKDSILSDDLKTIEEHIDIKRHKRGNDNKEILPERTVQTQSDSINTAHETNHIKNPVCLKVDPDNRVSSEPEDVVHKDIEQEQQVQYREVLQAADLHYNQLENVKLNSVITQEQLSTTETSLVNDQICPEKETVAAHERDQPILDIDIENSGKTRKKSDVPYNKLENIALKSVIAQEKLSTYETSVASDPICPKRETVAAHEVNRPMLDIDTENSSTTTKKSNLLYEQLENVELNRVIAQEKLSTTETSVVPDQIFPKRETVAAHEINQPMLDIDTENPGTTRKISDLLYEQSENVELNRVITQEKLSTTEISVVPDQSFPKRETVAAHEIKQPMLDVDTENSSTTRKKSDLLYEQLENVELNRVISQEKLSTTETSVVPDQICPKRETVAAHEINQPMLDIDTENSGTTRKKLDILSPKQDYTERLESQKNNTVSAEPPKDKEILQPIDSKEGIVQDEPENWKINIDIMEQPVESEKSESLSSKEEKVELFETDKLRMNTIDSKTLTGQLQQNSKSLRFEKESANHSNSKQLSRHQNQSETTEETGEFGRAENLKINILLSRNYTDSKKPKIKTDASLKPLIYNHSLLIGYEKKNLQPEEHVTLKGARNKDVIFEESKNVKVRGSVMPLHLNNYTSNVDASEPQNKGGYTELNQANINEADIVDLHSTISEVETKCEQNNYTPQIDIAKEMASNKESVEYTATNLFKTGLNLFKHQMTEQIHYTPQIYLQNLKFESLNENDLLHTPKTLEPHKEKLNESYDLEKVQILRFTNSTMTELNHYSTQIYTDAIAEAQKVLIPKEREKQLKKQALETTAPTVATETDIDYKYEFMETCNKKPIIAGQTQSCPQRIHPAICVAGENKNAAKLKKMRKNNIIFAQLDASAIDQSLNQVLHTKPKRVDKSTATKCCNETLTSSLHMEDDNIDVNVHFDEPILSLAKLDKNMIIQHRKLKIDCDDDKYEYQRKEDAKKTAASLRSEDLDILQNESEKLREKILCSRRDVGTCLLKEIKANVKERTPTAHSLSSRIPRRNRHRPQKDTVDAINSNYYDKVATEWIRNDQQNASHQFDSIASLHKAKYSRTKYADAIGNRSLETRTGQIQRMPKIEDEGFLAKAPAPICNKEHSVCEQATVNDTVAHAGDAKSRSGEISVKIEDVATELEKKFPEKCIVSSEIPPLFYNEEQIIMGDMSKGPLHLQYNSEQEAAFTEDPDIVKTEIDNDYHRKAILKLVSSISYLRGDLDEGYVPNMHSLHSYHDQQINCQEMLYKAVVDTVTKTDRALRKDFGNNYRGSESECKFYSAEDLSTYKKQTAKTPNELKNWNSSMASTETSRVDVISPAKNRFNSKNGKLTNTTVLNGDKNTTLNNHCCNLTGSQRNDFSADAFASAVRNYSKGSTSKIFDSKHRNGASTSKNCHEEVLTEMPQENCQRNGSTQAQPNKTTQQNMYCEHCQSNVRVHDNQNEIIDSFVDALPQGQEESLEDQEAILLSVSRYVETDPEPETNQVPEKEQCSDPSYVNAVETDYYHREDSNLPHVEQTAWDPREYESTQVTVESVYPADNTTQILPDQWSQQENNFNDKPNYYERFCNYHEPQYDNARQQYNCCTFNKVTQQMNRGQNRAFRNKETHRSNSQEAQTDEYKMAVDETQQTQEPWSEQMRSQSYYPCPNEQSHIYYYNYEQQGKNQYPFTNVSTDKESLEGNISLTNEAQQRTYNNHTMTPDFQFQDQPVHDYDFNEKFYDATMISLSHKLYSQSDPYSFLQGFNPPPSAGYVPTFHMIQNPSIAQALNFEQHNQYNNHGYYEKNTNAVPMYTESYREMDSHEITQAYNSRLEKVRALQNSYERSQKERTKQVKEEEAVSVPVSVNSVNAKERLVDEEKAQELPEPQANHNYNCFYNNYDNISEREQYSYNYDASYDNIPNTISYQDAPNYSSPQTFEGNESNHEYYDASSHLAIPCKCMQNNQNYNYYPYYSNVPDYALPNKYHKQYSNMTYSPYTHVSICPLEHKPGDRCEHCCAEDTSRPNELSPAEAETKTSDPAPKKSQPDVRFTKPRIKKRKSASRGSGRGTTERGTSVTRELELNTAINLPSLDENLKLSELLERVRKRNRLLNMVEVLKPYDPIHMVKCDNKDPPKPPSSPKILVGPGKCPTSDPEPCKIPCPQPTDPCDKHKPKDPYNRTSAEKLTLMLYVGKKGKERRPKCTPPKNSSDNQGGKRMAGVTQMLATALVKIRKLIEGSDTSLEPSDSEDARIDPERGEWRSLKQAEVIAETFRPRVKKGEKQTPLDHLKEGILQARKHIMSGFPSSYPADEVFYDA